MNPSLTSFDDLSLHPALAKAIQELGFLEPSPIQAQALPLLLGPKTDFVGLAATGTGKTAAFGIPLLQQIEAGTKKVQGLVLCPTRELAIQVAGQLNLLAKYLSIRAVPVYGGASFVDQIHQLKKHPQIVVGTPGRVIDHLTRKTLSLDGIQTLVLDEADEMISMGFQEALETILSHLPPEKSKTWLFSATMSAQVRKVSEKYLKTPKQVQINKTKVLSATVQQLYYSTQESQKPEVLCKIMDAADYFYGIVFCQTKALVIELTQFLKNKNYKVDCLHGDMDQNARERTMKVYRDKGIQVLVCTDVASRGLDVKEITHVINYSLPREMDVYVHRIGRTARSGKEGCAISLVTPSHRGLIHRIEKVTQSRMIEATIPTRQDIAAKKVGLRFKEWQEVKLPEKFKDLIPAVWQKVLTEMPAHEIAARFLTLLLPELGGAPGLASTASPSAATSKGVRGSVGVVRADQEAPGIVKSGRFDRNSARSDRSEGRGKGPDSRPYRSESRSESRFGVISSAPSSSPRGTAGASGSKYDKPRFSKKSAAGTSARAESGAGTGGTFLRKKKLR